jgi:hypothetical protein
MCWRIPVSMQARLLIAIALEYTKRPGRHAGLLQSMTAETQERLCCVLEPAFNTLLYCTHYTATV